MMALYNSQMTDSGAARGLTLAEQKAMGMRDRSVPNVPPVANPAPTTAQNLGSLMASMGTAPAAQPQAQQSFAYQAPAQAPQTQQSFAPPQAPQASPQAPPHYYEATDQSAYINNIYEAQRKAQVAALDGAYGQQMAAHDYAASQLPEIYQSAKNNAAGNAAVQQQNMNERFAASGLNSGTSGQASLAMSNVAQGNLNALDTDMANRLAGIEQQRMDTKTAYQTEIAKAIAANEMAQAQALYSEAVRVDNSFTEQQAIVSYGGGRGTATPAAPTQDPAMGGIQQQQGVPAQTMAGVLQTISGNRYNADQVERAVYGVWDDLSAAQKNEVNRLLRATGWVG